MAEMSDIFTKTSRVLRDNVVTELQKSNDFLRNYIIQHGTVQAVSPLYRTKVIICQHPIPFENDTLFPRTEGVLIQLKDIKASVLYKDENNDIKLVTTSIKNLIFVDEKINNFFE